MQPNRLESKYKQFISFLEIADFDLLIIMAIGSRDSLHNEIEEIYRLNRDTYYELYRNSPYFNDNRLTSLSVQNYRAIQQFLGIYLFEQSIGTNQTTIKLIKKGYRFVYNFVKNQFRVDFYKLRDRYMEYVKKNVLEKNVHAAHLFGIALYLCEQLDKVIIYDSFDIDLINNAIEQVFLVMEVSLEESRETEEYMEQYRRKGTLKKDFSLPLKDLIVSMNRHYQKEDGDEELHTHDFYKGLSKVALMLQYCNINPLDLQNITNMDQARMKEIVSLSLSAIDIFQLDEAPESLLGTYLLIYALATNYNLTKHDLVVTAQEEVQQELYSLKNEYEHKIQLSEKEEKQKNNKLKQHEESNKRLIEKIQELEKQLQKKETLLEEQADKIIALESEQERLINQIKFFQNPIVEEKGMEEMAKVVSNFNCVIVGGLKSWQEQLKEYIPSARFIQADELHINLDFLLGADLIFFNESVNSHAMYQRIKAKLEQTSVPICYSGRNTNVYFSLKKIYEMVKER